jgi:hypothetical protein
VRRQYKVSGVLIRLALVASHLAGLFAGCAESLNPAQGRAYDAFKDCRRLAPTANLTRLTPDGGLGFESREGDYQIMIKCLDERYGYKFQ